MCKKYPARRRTIREEYSLLRYETRALIDDGLHDDVTTFLARHDTSLGNFVSNLLDNKFASARFSDPSYPV